jgi:pimeloyl-ACP methyl ester carboxylesterase
MESKSKVWSWIKVLIWVVVIAIVIYIPIYFFSSKTFSEPPTSSGKKHAQTVLFVHGFSGQVNVSDFSQEMQELFGLIPDFQANMETWSWPSGGVSPTTPVVEKAVTAGKWLEANSSLVPEAAVALAETINRYEEEGRTYYLIGHSLGAKVVAEALKKPSHELKMLKGIYFMGAAFPSDTELKGIKLPDDLKIINFYSPEYDLMLKEEYRRSTLYQKEAGGRVGFIDNTLFVNLKTDASHSPSDDKCNFLNMATAIGFLIAKKEGYTTEGKPIKTDCDLPSPAQNRWNNIFDLGSSIVQQNSCPESNNDFRIVDKQSGKTLEQNCNLHTLMKGKW